MKKTLIVILLLSILVSINAFGASTRWRALGGDHRFIIDTSNYSLYPGRLNQFGNALFLIPVPNFTDDSIASGVLLNIKRNMTIACQYNLSPAGVNDLRATLAGFDVTDATIDRDLRNLRETGTGDPDRKTYWERAARSTISDRLASLKVNTFPDLLCGMRMGDIVLGARVAISKDSIADEARTFEEKTTNEAGIMIEKRTVVPEEATASAQALDISLGATLYKSPIGEVDLGISIGKQSFSSEDPYFEGIKIESTGGSSFAFNTRVNMKKKDYTIVPILSFSQWSPATAEYNQITVPETEAISCRNVELGVGLRKKVKDRGLVLVAALGGINSRTYTPTTTVEIPAETAGEPPKLEAKELTETTDSTSSVSLLAGAELPIKKWLFVRGGVSARLASVKDETLLQSKIESYVGEPSKEEEVIAQTKATEVGYNYDMGVRAIFNGWILDFLLTRNIFHRGPFALSGATGTLATHVCLTYAF